MLVDKYDVNEDAAISDTELLAHVRTGIHCKLIAICLLFSAFPPTLEASPQHSRVCSPRIATQLEHMCMEDVTHVTSRKWSQPTRVRYQSQYPPELPMHVPRPGSPEQRRVAQLSTTESPSSRERAMSPEVVRTVVISATGQPKRDRSRSRSRWVTSTAHARTTAVV